MSIFIQVVFPVILIFLSGFLIQKWRRLDIKSVSTIVLYVMTPALVFRTFYTTELNVQHLNMVIFGVVILVSCIILTKIIAKIKKYPQSIESGMILSTAFMNSGNYGAPIILFAYGEEGFAYAISFMVLQAIFQNLFGVYYAAKGEDGFKIAIKSVLSMPATYATIIALSINLLEIPVPNNLLSAFDLVANAAIPTMMLVLGMQLSEIKIKNMQWERIFYGTFIRLFISPAIAFIIVLLLPMDPILEKVLIASAAMPTAAATTLYAVQFNSEPELVSSITLITTVLSVLTITILLLFLG